jgi:hypothetical protein
MISKNYVETIKTQDKVFYENSSFENEEKYEFYDQNKNETELSKELMNYLKNNEQEISHENCSYVTQYNKDNFNNKKIKSNDYRFLLIESI